MSKGNEHYYTINSPATLTRLNNTYHLVRMRITSIIKLAFNQMAFETVDWTNDNETCYATVKVASKMIGFPIETLEEYSFPVAWLMMRASVLQHAIDNYVTKERETNGD